MSDDKFNTKDMSDALSQDGKEGQEGQEGQSSGRAPIQEGWAPATPYIYDAQQVGWEGNAPVYDFDESAAEFGDVGPKHPELELQLFGNPETRGINTVGLNYDAIDTIEVKQRGEHQINPITSFKEAGLHPVMLENVAMAGYKAPTPIQRYTLPAVRDGQDVVAIAQTGSGKTAAYLIPILSKLMGKAKKLAAPRPNPAEFIQGVTQPVRAEPLVVVVCPTRELAVQIFSEARKFCYRSMLRPCVAYGGGSMRDQIEQLGKGCDVLIASPGRLVDFISRPNVLTLSRLRYMVIDEADEMLQDDWSEELKAIMVDSDQESSNVKYMLFSATFPHELRKMAREHLDTSHSQINVGRIGSTHRNIMQRVIEIAPESKREELIKAVESIPPSRTIVFVNSKRVADEIDDFLFNMGFPCTSMHGDRTQLEREAAMRAFRAGTSPILVATGVTARGIDVSNVQHVINYDLPSMDHGGIEEYTHRIGRTGRMGHRGIATSFYDSERDAPIASVLVRTLLETDQTVPDFLESYRPEDEDRNKWEINSEPEDRPKDAGGDFGDGGFGAEDDAGGAWGQDDDAGNGNDNEGAGAGGWGQDGGNDKGADAPDAAPSW